MNGYVEILSAGVYSTIQDKGRLGFRKYGVPVSGAMDLVSSSLANRILNNDEQDAVMEVTLSGPKLLFSASTYLAITGANISPLINETPILLNKPILVSAGDMLSFGKLQLGSRCYIGVKGGFQTDLIFGSRSYFHPLSRSGRLEKGDKISTLKTESILSGSSSIKSDPNHFSAPVIECSLGPEYDSLSVNSKQYIFESEFAIAPENNRMGYRLDGPGLSLKMDRSMLTSSVLPGTVQLTPSGNLIILMRDCQTTGGYPRILQLTDRAINQMAQKKSGDKFQFKRFDYP